MYFVTLRPTRQRAYNHQDEKVQVPLEWKQMSLIVDLLDYLWVNFVIHNLNPNHFLVVFISTESESDDANVVITTTSCASTWRRHQMETLYALLALCAGNSPVTGEFPAQRPVTQSFDVFFDLRLNKRLSKQSWGWWFETPLRSLWRQSIL